MRTTRRLPSGSSSRRASRIGIPEWGGTMTVGSPAVAVAAMRGDRSRRPSRRRCDRDIARRRAAPLSGGARKRRSRRRATSRRAPRSKRCCTGTTSPPASACRSNLRRDRARATAITPTRGRTGARRDGQALRAPSGPVGATCSTRPDGRASPRTNCRRGSRRGGSRSGDAPGGAAASPSLASCRDTDRSTPRVVDDPLEFAAQVFERHAVLLRPRRFDRPSVFAAAALAATPSGVSAIDFGLPPTSTRPSFASWFIAELHSLVATPVSS